MKNITVGCLVMVIKGANSGRTGVALKRFPAEEQQRLSQYVSQYNQADWWNVFFKHTVKVLPRPMPNPTDADIVDAYKASFPESCLMPLDGKFNELFKKEEALRELSFLPRKRLDK